MSTLFQPNFGVFGIDLSGDGCCGLPVSNRYSHPSSKKCDFCRCKSRFSCVSAAFQLRFSSLERGWVISSLWGPKFPRPSKSDFWSHFFFVFQLRFSWQKRGAGSPSSDLRSAATVGVGAGGSAGAGAGAGDRTGWCCRRICAVWQEHGARPSRSRAAGKFRVAAFEYHLVIRVLQVLRRL